jgi:hypothetical protein
VIDLILKTLDEDEALRRAGVAGETTGNGSPEPARSTPPPETDLTERLPPVVTVLEPATGATVRETPVKVRINVRSPSGAPVSAVRVRIDGRPLTARGDVVYQPDRGSAARDFHREIEIPVPQRDCTVEILAEADGAVSEPARLHLRWAAPEPERTRELYVLAVGVSEYQNPAYRLRYAARDARDVAEAVERLGRRTYDGVHRRVLADGGALRDSLLDGLDWLRESATADDVVVIFLAGHGINDGEYFFLPHDADSERRYRTQVPDSLLRSSLRSLPGRVVLFLDTCRAGSLGGTEDELRRRLDVTSVVNALTRSHTGLVVFSAAAGQQLSQESPAWKNGAFTEALLAGLDGAADLNGNGELTPSELDGFLSTRVPELTDGAQVPVMAKPGGVPDFVLLRTGSGGE